MLLYVDDIIEQKHIVNDYYLVIYENEGYWEVRLDDAFSGDSIIIDNDAMSSTMLATQKYINLLEKYDLETVSNLADISVQ